MNKIKILITYKEKHKKLESDIIVPIQTGRAIATEIFDEMIGDDTGDNISARNNQYCELTAQYWAWKHYEQIGSPEYIGFMHYRRHFIFKEEFQVDKSNRWHPNACIYKVPYFDKQCNENLNSNNILSAIDSTYDCYVYKPYNINFFMDNNLYMKEHYIATIPGAKRYVWDVFYNAVKSLYPQYEEVLNRFSYGHYMIFCNMFIMKKDLFFEFSEFAFNVLDKLYKEVDYSEFDSTEQRFCGYLGEYLLSMFVMILQDRNAKIKYLDGYFIEKPDEHYPNKTVICNNKKEKLNKPKQNKPYFININFFGIKFKIVDKKKAIYYHLKENSIILKQLSTKVTELQEEISKIKQS